MKKIILAVLCILLFLIVGCEALPAPAVVPVQPSAAVSPPPSPTPFPAASALPTPTPKPLPTRITVMAAGDLLCLYAQLGAARKSGAYQFDYCFDQIKAAVSSADLAIANFETLVVPGKPLTKDLPEPPPPDPSATGEPEPFKHGNTRMNAPEPFLAAVVNCGFDVLTAANNHIGDQKAEGIVSTLQLMDKYGVRHTGAYSAKEDKKPLIVDVKGIKLAILAYTGHINNSLGKGNAFMVDRYQEDLVAADIAAARAAGADYVIVSIHWGSENTYRPNGSQKKMAKFIANAGADIILGSHPHCIQPFDAIETPRGSVPVIYSLGNFISSMGRTMNRDGLLLSMVLEQDVEKSKTTLVKLAYTPTYCCTTASGSFVVLPANPQSIAAGGHKGLQASRDRTIKFLADKVAVPE